MGLCCPQQLKVNGLDVVIKGRKARRAMMYGINGVLEPVRRNCDEVKRKLRYVSNSMTYTFAQSQSTPFKMFIPDIDRHLLYQANYKLRYTLYCETALTTS